MHRLLLPTACAFLLAGCAALGDGPPDAGSVERNLRAQGFDPSGVIIP